MFNFFGKRDQGENMYIVGGREVGYELPSNCEVSGKSEVDLVIRDFHISGSEVDGYYLVLELDSSNNAEIPEVLRGHLVSEARNSSVILDLPPEIVVSDFLSPLLKEVENDSKIISVSARVKIGYELRNYGNSIPLTATLTKLTQSSAQSNILAGSVHQNILARMKEFIG